MVVLLSGHQGHASTSVSCGELGRVQHPANVTEHTHDEREVGLVCVCV